MTARVLIFSHPYDYKVNGHWCDKLFSEFTDMTTAQVDTVDPLETGEATYKMDGFSDEFIDEHAGKYDFVFLPDCGGDWWDFQVNDDLKGFFTLISNVQRLLVPKELSKEGGILVMGKLQRKRFRDIIAKKCKMVQNPAYSFEQGNVYCLDSVTKLGGE